MLAARLLPIIANRRKLSVALSGATASASSVGNGPFTTNAITATPAGGVTPYAYSWAKVSGDTFTIGAATAATTDFSASGTAPETKGATYRVTVTDAAGVVVTADVTVSMQFQVAGLSVSLDKSTASASDTGNGPFTTDTVTASPVGGVGPYSYLWEEVSGDTVSAGSGSSAGTNWSASGTAPETKAAVWRCKITDSLSTVAYSANVAVSIAFNTVALSVSLDKSSAYGENLLGAGESGDAATDTVTATPVGGVSSFTYAWELVSGDSSTSATAASSAASAFTRNSIVQTHYNSTWRCKVTDSLGTIAYSDPVAVLLEFEP